MSQKDQHLTISKGPGHRRSITLKVLGMLLIAGFVAASFAIYTLLVHADTAGNNVRSDAIATPYLPHRPHMKIIDDAQMMLPDPSRPVMDSPDVGGVDPNFVPNVSEGTSRVFSTATQPDGKFLIGGIFSSTNGVTRRCIDRFNADGTHDDGFNPGGSGANGAVYVILVLPDGRLMIAGSFSSYNGVPALKIARLNAEGTLDPTFIPQGTSINGTVQDMIIQPDGKILLSGTFTSFNAVTRNAVCRLNADGTLDSGFNPNPNTNFVEELILQPDGKIFIGGVFSTVDGTPRNSVARLNADGTLDTSFDVGSGVQYDDGSPGGVYAAERQADGKILIGGDFDTYNGVQRGVARINTDGSLDLAFDPDPVPGSHSGGVEFFAVQPDGKILIAGFGPLPGAPTGAAILRINADGTTDTSFTQGMTDDFGYVVALQSDGKILLGGLFSQFVGSANSNFVRLNPNGSLDNVNVSVALEPIVYAIARAADEKYIIGGQFRRVNGIARRNIARLNSDGSFDPTFDPGTGADGPSTPFVYSLAVQPDGKILAGGLFQSWDGDGNRENIVRLNPTGTQDPSFNFFDSIALVRDIEVRAGGKIVLAGFFENIAQGVSSGIVKLNSDGTYDPTVVGTGAPNIVYRIVPNKFGDLTKSMIVGNFQNYNGTPRVRIALINDDGSLDTSFNPGTGFNAIPYAVEQTSVSTYMVAGAFTAYNGIANTSRIVHLNSNGTVVPGFSTVGTSFNGSIFTISVEPDGKPLVGGLFTNYNGVLARGLARLNLNGTLDTTFSSQLSGQTFDDVETFYRHTQDGQVVVAGRFIGIGGTQRTSIARLNGIPTGSCTNVPIAYGHTIAANLNSNACIINGPTDTYTFAGTTGQPIVIALDSVGANGIQNAALELIAPDGSTSLATNSGTINARIPATGSFTLPSNGTYTIRVTSPGSFGDYNLSLSLLSGAPCTYTASPSSATVTPSGGTFYFDVLSGVGCPTVPATLGANSGHIQILSNSAGRVTYSVDPYTGATNRVGSIIAGGSTHTITQLGVAPPSNDFFAQAQVLPGLSGTVNGHNINATAEPGEPPHAGNTASHSVWYRWTAPSDGLFSFTTSGSTFDTVMAIYTGGAVNTLTPVAANDDTTEFDATSKINFRATAGTVYSIAIDGKNGVTGSIQLSYSRYRRLYRLYLQNFNGLPSPIVPDSVTARRLDNTGPIITASVISLGVYEFDLPDDNSGYLVTITGPTGILWQPPTYVIENFFYRFNELMEGAEGGGQNQTSNATNEIPVHFLGFIHGISSPPELAALRVQVASIGGPNAVPPRDCPDPVLVGGGPDGALRVLYNCEIEPDTTHEIVPNAPQTAFQVPVLNLPVLGGDTGPASANAIIATDSPTYNIGGRVLSGTQGLPSVAVDITTATFAMRVFSDSSGNYTAPNLAPGAAYTVQASSDGFIFTPQVVNLQPPGATVDLMAQTCSYTLAGNGTFPNTGGTGEFSVTSTYPSCGWTALRDFEWISVLSGSGVGNGSVQFSVEPNTGPARQGTIHVGNQAFTIDQAAGCVFTLSQPTQVNFPASGGTGSFSVTANAGDCAWSTGATDYCMVSSLTGGGTGNGTVNFTIAPNHGVARSVTFYVGGQSVTVDQAAAAGQHRTRLDFDGDGRADISVYRPVTGEWFILGSTIGFTGVAFGQADDIRAPADYDGDGKTDVGVYRPSTGTWYWINSSDEMFMAAAFGVNGDIPVPADYDGDGRADIAVYRPSAGIWYRLRTSLGFDAVSFGLPEDKPIAADYDGDGKADIAVYRPSNGGWYRLNSTDGAFVAIGFGLPDDVPVPADFDGDGRADISVFRPSDSYWYRLNSSDGQFAFIQFGVPGDKPVPADFNGDSAADIAVFRPANGVWYVWSCTNNAQIGSTGFGLSTDEPLPYPITP